MKLHFEGDVKRTKSYHEGANDERTAILAKLRRVKKLHLGENEECCGDTLLSGLINWLLTRDTRYKKRNGGL